MVALSNLIFGMTLFLIAAPMYAALTATAQKEIDHLIDFVGNSGCDFYRNGTWYTPDKGRAHLKDKYEYAKNHSLSSADEFVQKVASSSSVSGRPYKVRCNGTEAIASDWLGRELARYRDAASSGAMAKAPPETLNCRIRVAKDSENSNLSKMAKISLANARRRALADIKDQPKKVMQSELEVEQDCLVYSFDIRVGLKSGVEEIWVDAGNGKILSHKHETPQQETAEQSAEKLSK